MSYTNSGRVPCKYFQQGRCTRGNSCKFAHVRSNGTTTTGEGTQNMSEADIYRSFVSPSSLNKIERTIANDIRDVENFQQKPLTSAYSYGVPCALNLISGRDYSPEESRFDFYKSQRQGTGQQYIAQINAREKDMQKCLSHVKSHPDWAARYLQKNTKDLVETGQRSMKNEFVNFPIDLGGGNTFGTSTFGTSTQTSSGPFGRPTSAGAFGTPAFGASSFGTPPGGPVNTGSSVKPPIVRENPFGSKKLNNVFGTSSNPFIANSKSTTGAFGQPAFGSTSGHGAEGSSFGKPAFGSSAPTTSASSAFGKPAFGSSAPPASGGSAFGKPAFGSSASPTNGGSAFGTPAFGSSPAVANVTSAFGKPAFASTNSNAFGGVAFGKQAFGSASTPFNNLQTSGNTTFGQPTFGSTSLSAMGAPPFGKAAFSSTSIQNGSTTSAFGQPSFKSSSPFNGNGNSQATATFGSSNVTAVQAGLPFGSGNSPFGSTTVNSSSPFTQIQSNAQSTPFEPSAFVSKAQLQNPSSAVPSSAGTTFGIQESFSKASTPLQTQVRQRKFIQGKPAAEDNLTAKELDQQTLRCFRSSHFSLGNVPDIPPPLELVT
ncbi:uncharacterized protein ZBIST_1090 [Zygosaccharomyces bailii]|nr:uncharacterized protein ZBIST_1090 [Zygosaccharomyces bailii]